MLKIKPSQNINVLFLIRFFVLYISVFCAVVCWAEEWCSAQLRSSPVLLKTQASTEKAQKKEHSLSFFFICVWFQGGRGLVSTAIKLILAIKITPPFSFHHFPMKSHTKCPDKCTAVLFLSRFSQLPLPLAFPNQKISFISFKKQEMYSSICLVFNKVLELP